MNVGELFAACKHRFDNDDSLVLLARRMYRSTPNREQPPYVNFVIAEHTIETTFGGQFAVFQLDLTVVTKQEHPGRCDQILKRLREVFDFTTLPGAPFTVGGFDPVSVTTPEVEDATWKATIRYAVVLNPLIADQLTRSA